TSSRMSSGKPGKLCINLSMVCPSRDAILAQDAIDPIGVGAVMFEMVTADHLLGKIRLELMISEAQRRKFVAHGDGRSCRTFSKFRPGAISSFPNGRSRS